MRTKQNFTAKMESETQTVFQKQNSKENKSAHELKKISQRYADGKWAGRHWAWGWAEPFGWERGQKRLPTPSWVQGAKERYIFNGLFNCVFYR